MSTAAAGKIATPASAGLFDWPKELAQQMRAVRDVVQQAEVPLQATQVAVRFRRTKPEKVQPLLYTLTALALLRETDEGGYLG